jgi:hypothetical protein
MRFLEISTKLQKFYEEALKYIGFSIFLFGIIYSIIKKEKLLLRVFTLSILSFLFIIFKSGFNFSHHTYYIIPFVPIMALMAGYGLNQFGRNISLIILIAICLESTLNQIQDFRIHEGQRALLKLENDLDKFSSKNDLILINSGGYPTPMYFAHRKGWVDYNKNISDLNYIKTLKDEGLKYIVVLKKIFGTDIDLGYTIVLNNENYCIYKL